jgi:hypothetical protein
MRRGVRLRLAGSVALANAAFTLVIAALAVVNAAEF